MNKEIINKLDEITNIIQQDQELKEYKILKEKILNNKELLNKINMLKEMNDFDKKYVELKKEILSNNDYSRFIELENKLFFDVKDINNHINCLLEKRGCN